MELNSKIAKYIKERDTIEQKTKDELAFQALQHRVEKEKAKLLFLQHKSKEIGSQNGIDDNNIKNGEADDNKKSSSLRQGVKTSSALKSVLPPREMYRPLKSLSIAEVSVLLRHYDLTLFVEKFRKCNIDGRELSEFQFQQDIISFNVGRRTQHMKLLHLISELNERGVSDKMFLELKRHDARIKRLTKRIKTPAGPVSQMYIESQRNGFRKPIPRAGHRVRKDFHQQKGNKIVRGEDRRSHLYDHSHRGCPDSPDDPAGAQKAAPFSISNGVMIESRHRSRASTNRYLRRGDNNPIEFV